MVLIRALSIVVSPLGELPASLFYYGSVLVVQFYCLVLSEIALYRLSIDWVWKRIPPMNDYFLARYLTLLNLVLSTLASAMNGLAKDSLSVYFSIQGIQNLPDMDFGKFRIYLGQIVLTLTSVPVTGALVTVLLKKGKKWLRQTTPVIPITFQDELYNNHSRNKEVLGASAQVVLLVLTLVIVLPYFLLVGLSDGEKLTIEESGMLELTTVVFLYVLLPLLLYVRNRRLRHYFATLICPINTALYNI